MISQEGKERYVVEDEITHKWKIRSPWYDYEATRRSPKEMAEELDMNHMGAGGFRKFCVDGMTPTKAEARYAEVIASSTVPLVWRQL